MSIDLSRDWELVEGPQTVTLYPRLSENTYGPGVEVTDCNRMAVNTLAASSDEGDLEVRQTTWDLWAAKLGAAVPKMGDRIEDAQHVKWNLKEVTHCDLDAGGVQRYHCLAQRED
jgi:hypothetical protein